MHPSQPSVPKPAQKLPEKIVARRSDNSSTTVINFVQITPEELQKMINKIVWRIILIQSIVLLIVIIAGHVLGINACQSESMKWACYTAGH